MYFVEHLGSPGQIGGESPPAVRALFYLFFTNLGHDNTTCLLCPLLAAFIKTRHPSCPVLRSFPRASVRESQIGGELESRGVLMRSTGLEPGTP